MGIINTSSNDSAAVLNIGTLDAFSRPQALWYTAANSILRLGASQGDGDSSNVLSNGIVIYGQDVSADPMSSTKFTVGRFASDKFYLKNFDGANITKFFLADTNGISTTKNDGTNTFNLDRATGNLTLLGQCTGSIFTVIEGAATVAFDTLLPGGSLTVSHTYYYVITQVDALGNESIASNIVSTTPTTGNQKIRLYKANFNTESGGYLNVYRSDSTSFGATSFLAAVLDNDQPTYIIDDGTVALTSGTPPASSSSCFIRLGLPVVENKISNWIGRMAMVSDTDGLWYLLNSQYKANARWDRDFALASGYDGTWLNAPTGLSVHIGVDGREGGSTPGYVMAVNSGGVAIGANLTASTSTMFRVDNGRAAFVNAVNDETINIIQNTSAGSAAVASLYFYNGTNNVFDIRTFGNSFSSSGIQQANGVSLEAVGKFFVSSLADNPIHFYVNSSERMSISSSALTSNVMLDLSSIAAGSAEMKVAATSDTPSTTYTAHVASTDPAGYIKLNVGGSSRYLPFYT